MILIVPFSAASDDLTVLVTGLSPFLDTEHRDNRPQLWLPSAT